MIRTPLRCLATVRGCVVLAILVALLSACSFEPGQQPTVDCVIDGDCPEGWQCAAGMCVGVSAPGEELGRDAGEADGGGVDTAVDPDGGQVCTGDQDQDGFGTSAGCPADQRDCDDGDPLVHPGADEACNGVDDDCDGTIDPGCSCTTGETRRCGSEEGACQAGTQSCEGGSWGACDGAVEPVSESCNGVDDDCDGEIDEEITQACQTDCGAGTQRCSQGAWGACVVASPPPETCDGIDNDCDGAIDESPDGLLMARSCGGGCPGGSVQLCVEGLWTDCVYSEVEICDGADSNCDNRADNRNVCYRACGASQIVAGTLDCSATGLARCVLSPEICGDGIDNDCDGQIDQGCDPDLDDMAFVAGGTFLMGSFANAAYTQADETPIHVVELPAFLIDRFEVSRADYGRCVQQGVCSSPDANCASQPTSQGDLPIVCVSQEQAASYCAWRGKRLPTEAEWEKAARGPFNRARLWPWGNVENTSRGVFDCNDSANQCLSPVDTYAAGASYYGVRNMAGNAAEWVSDHYDAQFYANGYVVDPEQTVDQGDGHGIRGGGYSQSIAFGRVANRAHSGFLDAAEIGFRCARDLP